ncbi:MAG: hypothetical protein CAF41_010975 [Nitrospira sp. CG24A]|nr:MAG: hypothetical protein CAF41_010975 [Nitrospira sp. CG24A]
MKAVAATPGQANSVHEIPNGRGVWVLARVAGGDREHSIPANTINLDVVLGNKLVVGTVNANREYFEAGVYDWREPSWKFQAGSRSC